jgi:hypothetical protein
MRYVLTIQEGDVGSVLKRNRRSYWLQSCIGRVLPIDYGKRVYEVTDNAGKPMHVVESDAQRQARQAKEPIR